MRRSLPLALLLLTSCAVAEDTSDGVVRDVRRDDGGADAVPDAEAGVDGAPDAEVGGDADAGADGDADADTDAAADADSDGDAGADGDADAGADSDAVEDAGADDAGDGAIWLEIDYSAASSPSSPAWSFSATPAFGAAQWATEGASYPEAWDRWDNMAVVDDPIGRALEIESGDELQVMIGLEELTGYDSATVRLEGRSRSTSSHVWFDVTNPLSGRGVSGEMSQDWTVHVVELGFGTCLLPGEGVQAVRVSPTSGTLALVRLRVTINGATW
ncbi:MAG: hypothetical protein HY905_08565 [Deltaproteobacteria bacterium]|nr:hypothetical protein [Deltaproteobacteria bacterium]